VRAPPAAGQQRPQSSADRVDEYVIQGGHPAQIQGAGSTHVRANRVPTEPRSPTLHRPEDAPGKDPADGVHIVRLVPNGMTCPIGVAKTEN
jgi:hypothetical protein